MGQQLRYIGASRYSSLGQATGMFYFSREAPRSGPGRSYGATVAVAIQLPMNPMWTLQSAG
jgi:hypothetical protein